MTSDEPTHEQRDQAALWIAKKTGGSLTPQDAAALEEWLNRDRCHRQAFDELRVLYAQIEVPARRAALQHPVRRRLFRHLRPQRRWLVPPAIGLAVFCLVWLVTPNLLQNWQADIVTGRQVVSQITLPDGSLARLGADTALQLDFSGAKRRVRLLRGEAYFDVRHDGEGVFTVAVETGEVRDIGTRFNVDVGDEATNVVVSQGAVAVLGTLDRVATTLREGQRVALAHGRTQTVEKVDPALPLSWMSGRLVVENMRVKDVVKTLQRHAAGRIAVRGSLADRRISGTFPLTDAEASLETIADAVGGSIMRVTPLLTVLY